MRLRISNFVSYLYSIHYFLILRDIRKPKTVKIPLQFTCARKTLQISLPYVQQTSC
jgi:hypothetical protein